jgi:hypothetical protein
MHKHFFAIWWSLCICLTVSAQAQLNESEKKLVGDWAGSWSGAAPYYATRRHMTSVGSVEHDVSNTVISLVKRQSRQCIQREHGRALRADA